MVLPCPEDTALCGPLALRLLPLLCDSPLFLQMKGIQSKRHTYVYILVDWCGLLLLL